MELGPRGHPSLKAACDAVLEVRKLSQRTSVLSIAKMKDGDDTLRCAFELDVIPLGFDGDGDPITSCVVREIETPEPKPKASKYHRTDALVLNTLKEALSREGELCSGRFGLPSALRVVDRQKVYKALREQGFEEDAKEETARRQFTRRVQALVGENAIGAHQETTRRGWLWLKTEESEALRADP
jgi:hypothetical protein